jgi:hypothetical protein
MHQLNLILKNINLPFDDGPSTYAKVVDVWKQAMHGMEDFLCGRPQSISRASLFLAFSAWHLFPDLIVLGDEIVNVKFHDKLIPTGGVGTVGAETLASAAKNGIQWSLALSHLRYYGGPVVVESDPEFSRLTVSQLRIVTLGSLFGAWRIRTKDITTVVRWFPGLWDRLPLSESESQDDLPRYFGWLYNLVKAARKILISNCPSHQQNMTLLEFGIRRAKYFLSKNSPPQSPFFGLCNIPVIRALAEKTDVDCGISYLRDIAKRLELQSNDAIICKTYISSSYRFIELATAVPHARASAKHDLDGKLIQERVHARWFFINQPTSNASTETTTSSTWEEFKKGLKNRIVDLEKQGELLHG